MSRWLIKIEGERTDLDELLKWFPDGNIHALEENGEYFLTGNDFDNANNAGEIKTIANEALNQYAAIISLLWPSFCTPTIANIIHEENSGRKNNYIFVAGTIRGRSKVSAELSVTNEETVLQPLTQAQELLFAAKKNPHLREALTVWGNPTKTWGRLYRLVEEIQKHFGQSPDKIGLCSKSDLDRFKRTANTAESSGIDSRHASNMFKVPRNPMSLEEATTFVGQLLTKTLRK